VIIMTGSGIKYPDEIKADHQAKLMLSNEEMDEAIKENKKKSLLRDDPAVTRNQNVYDSLSE